MNNLITQPMPPNGSSPRTAYLASCSIQEIITRELKTRREIKKLGHTSSESTNPHAWVLSSQKLKRHSMNASMDHATLLKVQSNSRTEIKNTFTNNIKPNRQARQTKLAKLPNSSSSRLPVIAEESPRSDLSSPKKENKAADSCFETAVEEYEDHSQIMKKYSLLDQVELNHSKNERSSAQKNTYWRRNALQISSQTGPMKGYPEELIVHQNPVELKNKECAGIHNIQGDQNKIGIVDECTGLTSKDNERKEKDYDHVRKLKEELAKKESQVKTLVNLVKNIEKKLRITKELNNSGL